MSKITSDKMQLWGDCLSGPGLIIFCCALFSFIFLLSGCESSTKPTFATPYQAVLLDNNSAYFGKIESIDKDFIVLKDVFYIQTQTSADGKQMSSVLIKRGQEMHGPDKMYITRQHVVMIEPVSSDSRIAKLIDQQKEQSKASQK